MNAKTKSTVAKPKASPTSESRKAKVRPSRSAHSARLGCRYCGSDDLAPSFKKQRDARCRACFKQRYGSAVQGKRTARTHTPKAAK